MGDDEPASDHRYYRLNGVYFRVDPNRPGQGAQYFFDGGWAETGIPSVTIIGSPHSVEVSLDDVRPLGPGE